MVRRQSAVAGTSWAAEAAAGCPARSLDPADARHQAVLGDLAFRVRIVRGLARLGRARRLSSVSPTPPVASPSAPAGLGGVMASRGPVSLRSPHTTGAHRIMGVLHQNQDCFLWPGCFLLAPGHSAGAFEPGVGLQWGWPINGGPSRPASQQTQQPASHGPSSPRCLARPSLGSRPQRRARAVGWHGQEGPSQCTRRQLSAYQALPSSTWSHLGPASGNLPAPMLWGSPGLAEA